MSPPYESIDTSLDHKKVWQYPYMIEDEDDFVDFLTEKENALTQ
jgi:hypothetical protein